MPAALSADAVKAVAKECGFELAGIAPVGPVADWTRYQEWAASGMAGRMSYLTDHRAKVRVDPRQLLPSARSILCVGKLYQTNYPATNPALHEGWISRYAWGDDYHDVVRLALENVVARLAAFATFEYRVCVDTAPLLERSLARQAGLGWIGKNTCLINQQQGSWFFLGELLLSLDLAPDAPPPGCCGTCTRCIDACPTHAIIPDGNGQFQLDARRCISYFTIELKGDVPQEHREAIGTHVFGCDICQDVCPWNRRAPSTTDPAFEPRQGRVAPELETLLYPDSKSFRQEFIGSPVLRPGYRGFLRNVAIAMGNSADTRFREPLERLAASDDAVVASHARWALARLARTELARKLD